MTDPELTGRSPEFEAQREQLLAEQERLLRAGVPIEALSKLDERWLSDG